jgi:hypothetical protein
MKIVIITICFFICASCLKRETQKENHVSKQVLRNNENNYENAINLIIGNYVPDEGCCNCTFNLKFTRENNKVVYHLKTIKRDIKGIADISITDKKYIYITIPIEWDDYQGDVTLKSYKPYKGKKPMGISMNFDPEFKRISFQNYGDAMNNYIKFCECDNDKGIMLVNEKSYR